MALSDAKSAQVKTYLPPLRRLRLCASALRAHSSSSSSSSASISGSILRYSLFVAIAAGLIFADSIASPAIYGSIVPFNLETEEWMGTLKGPEPVTRFYREHNEVVVSSSSQVVELLSLTDLNGSLVTVHAVCNSCMDLWFLSDFEKGLWVKKYSIDFPYNRRSAYPLLLLDDERVVFLVQATDVLQCYDPKAGTYTDMLELESFRSVGIYTGNLLSLEDGFA